MNLTKPWKSLSLLLVVALGTVACPASALMAQETWTDVSGEKTLTAEFVKLEGVQLTLKKADGKEIVLPLSKLDDKSRLKARAIAKSGGVSDSSSSSTSDNGTGPTQNLTPVSFPSNPTAQEFMDIVVRELQKENPMVIWDALPASKQDQLQEVVKLASTKIEQRTLNRIKKFRADLLTVLRSKKDLVLNSQIIPIPPDQGTVLAGSYDSLVGLIDVCIPAEWMDASYLQKTPVRDVLSVYMNKVVRKAKELEKSLPSDSPFKAKANIADLNATAQNITSNEAKVTMAAPGLPDLPVTFILSEGRWLPKDLVDNWGQAMTQLTSVLESANPKEIHLAVGRVLLLVESYLENISLAETQQEFDERIEQLMAMAQGMGGGMGPPGAGGPGR